METREKKKIKKKFNIARTLVFVLIIYIIVCLGIRIYKEPIRHFDIKGNKVLSDIEIIRDLGLNEYPSFAAVSPKKLSKELEKNPYVKSAKINYKWNFVLEIEIEENRPIFLVKLEDKVALSDGSLIDIYDNNLIGIPTLLNTTPDEIMKTLAKSLGGLNDGILYMINDIEYKPSYNSQNQVIDEYRFLLSMNDKNMVYINAKRLKSLNKYLDIIATNKITSNGTLYLDGTEENYFFKKYEPTTGEPTKEISEQ